MAQAWRDFAWKCFVPDDLSYNRHIDDVMVFQLDATSLPIAYGSAVHFTNWRLFDTCDGACTFDGRLRITTVCYPSPRTGGSHAPAEPFQMFKILHQWVCPEALDRARETEHNEHEEEISPHSIIFRFDGNGDGKGGRGDWMGGGFNPADG